MVVKKKSGAFLSRKKKSIKKHAGELRQDIITDKWCVIITGDRSKTPKYFLDKRPKPKKVGKYKDDCPFCNLVEYPQEPDVLRLPDDPDNWQVHVFGNKYPAFLPNEEFRIWQKGPYKAMESIGYHELLTPRWHNKEEHAMSIAEMSLLLEALVLRYRELKTKPSVSYIQIIRNHGKEAGGSQEHPHHQIFTTPVVPSDILDILHGSQRYMKRNKKEVFDVILKYERDQGERVIWENDYFIIFCPFASRVPFETWVMPKNPSANFENIGPDERDALAEAMQYLFRKIYIGLNDPPYNYYIHTAPCDDIGLAWEKGKNEYFRWHVEVMPRLTQWGGFEIGTGLEINTLPPEEAALYLRDIDITESYD